MHKGGEGGGGEEERRDGGERGQTETDRASKRERVHMAEKALEHTHAPRGQGD